MLVKIVCALVFVAMVCGDRNIPLPLAPGGGGDIAGGFSAIGSAFGKAAEMPILMAKEVANGFGRTFGGAKDAVQGAPEQAAGVVKNAPKSPASQ